jgi:hypothetical protein
VANGNILTRQEGKEQAAFDFYNSLLGTTEQSDITIDLEQLELPPHDLQELDAFFTKEECGKRSKICLPTKPLVHTVLPTVSTRVAGPSSNQILWQP